MKIFFQKLRGSSSTTRLIIFVVVILAVVLCASSGFYINYRNKKTSAPTPLVNSETSSIRSQTPVSQPASTSTSNQGSEASLQNSETTPSSAVQTNSKQQVACTKKLLKFKTVYKDAPWLNLGEATVTPGRDGYIQSCPSSPDITVAPVDQIMYRGIKIITIAPDLADSVTQGVRRLNLSGPLGL